MRKSKSKKRYLTGVLLMLTVVFAAGFSFSDLYAANEIEVSKTCSLTLQIPEQSTYGQELISVTLEADLYRIASVTKNGAYTATQGFEELEFSGEPFEEKEWENVAKQAAELAAERTADAEVSLVNGTGKAENLETGIYLVLVKNAMTDLHEYSFKPSLVMLPGRLYDEAGNVTDEAWQYDAVCSLKPEQSPRYGSLQIQKTLTAYNATLGEVTFVFQVEGVDEAGEIVYSNVVSTTHSEAGTKEVVIENLPAGTTVTVTEVYSGASYRLVTEPETTAVIVADEFVTAEFSNTYDEKLTPGYGVTNHFEYSEEEGWQWSALHDNSVQNQ